MSNVTPIRSGGNPPPMGPKKSPGRRPRSRDRFMLDDPPDGPSCMRVIQALHGVCQAAEKLAGAGDADLNIDLATAAEILSIILKERISNAQ